VGEELKPEGRGAKSGGGPPGWPWSPPSKIAAAASAPKGELALAVGLPHTTHTQSYT
jgi:hypothetical protein